MMQRAQKAVSRLCANAAISCKVFEHPWILVSVIENVDVGTNKW